MNVLAGLMQLWPVAVPMIEVALAAGFEARKTAAKHLHRLVDCGLASREHQLSGWLISARGRELVEYVEAKNSTDYPQITH